MRAETDEARRYAERRARDAENYEAWMADEIQKAFEARLGLRERRPRSAGRYPRVASGRRVYDALLEGRICREV